MCVKTFVRGTVSKQGMGQAASSPNLSAQYSLAGWPAFLSVADLRRAMTRYRAEKTLLGSRVRLISVRGGCIEYVRVGAHYQRVDAPCGSGHSPAKFPATLPRGAIPGGLGPLAATVTGSTYAEVANLVTKRCATYRRTESGVWVLTARACPETKHHWEVMTQQRGVARDDEDRARREVLAGRRPKKHETMRALLSRCPECRKAKRGRGCALDDPYFKPECQAALAAVGADTRAVRRREDARAYGATLSGRPVVKTR